MKAGKPDRRRHETAVREIICLRATELLNDVHRMTRFYAKRPGTTFATTSAVRRPVTPSGNHCRTEFDPQSTRHAPDHLLRGNRPDPRPGIAISGHTTEPGQARPLINLGGQKTSNGRQRGNWACGSSSSRRLSACDCVIDLQP